MSTHPQRLIRERILQRVFDRLNIEYFRKLPAFFFSKSIEITLIFFIVLVVVGNLLPKAVESKGGGLIFGYFNNGNNIIQTSERLFSEAGIHRVATQTLTTQIIILNSSQSLNGPDEQEYSLLTPIRAQTLINSLSPLTAVTQEPRDEVIEYVVKKGDNPSTIAATFGITTNTLLWANDLGFWDYIRPGDKLKILPISGVVHKVKSGDTIEAIAKKYKAEVTEIISFNELPADGKIEPEQVLVIPDGIKYSPRPTRRVYATSYPKQDFGSHKFPWGQCTWYVAGKRYVPWSGHAKQWLVNAKNYGFSVCWGSDCTPQQGAIVALRDGGWIARLYGHVAYVEKVTFSTITVSEMNRIGLGVRSVRVIPRNSWLIKGYIY